MKSDNRGFVKPIYDEMMDQFYEGNQRKHKNVEEPKGSSTLSRGLSPLTMDEGQTLIQVEELKKSLHYEELMEPSCLEEAHDHAEKVHAGFQGRQKQEVAKAIDISNVISSPNESSSKKPFHGTHINSEAKISISKIPSPAKPKDKSAAELNELLMEAKSSKDSSWYDVGTILNHRITGDGEIKARVRFAGFDSSHDEWVNVKRAIRQRSIPLKDSECHLVEVGDLVLCFRKRGDSDLYFDAHVMKIERNLHDIKGCRCIFQVCYDHDNYEELVGLAKLCRRPSE